MIAGIALAVKSLRPDVLILGVEAARAGEAGRCGPLLTASHASLRDDFEVSWPQADAAVECEADVVGRDRGGAVGGQAEAADFDAGAA